MIERLNRVLQRLGHEPSLSDLCDILWLARHLPPVQKCAAPAPAPPLEQPDITSADAGAEEIFGAPFSTPRVLKEEFCADDVAVFSAAEAKTDAGSSARRIRLPGAPPLPDALAVGRALRPLGRRRRSGGMQVLDERATAERMAESGLPLVVFAPAWERWFHLVLAVEEVPSLAAWRPTVNHFQRLLERHGGFRSVTRLALRARGSTLDMVTLNGTVLPAPCLRERGGRHMGLVVSDCTSEAWHQGSIGALLAHLGQRMPVAVAQLLPSELWPNTAIWFAEFSVSAAEPGLPTAGLRVSRPDWAEGELGFVIPVFPLKPAPVATWARMVMSMGSTESPAALLPLPEPGAMQESGHDSARKLSADEKVAIFRATTLGDAQRLGAYFSVVKPLTLPVMRMVQRAMLPETGTVALAQVLLGGILQPVGDPTATAEDAVEYDFHPDVRELLADGVKRPEFFRVNLAIQNYVVRQWGHPFDFFAYLEDQLGDEDIPGEARPFARFAREIADRFRAPGSPRSQTTRRPHPPSEAKNGINAFAITLNWRQVVSGSDDTTLRVWDLETGEVRQVLKGHTAAVNAVAITRDGRQVVSGSDDTTLRVWDLESGKVLKVLIGHTAAVNAVAITRDGRRVVSGSDDATLRVWDLESGDVRQVLKGHTAAVNAVALSWTHKVIVSASDDGNLRVWDLESGRMYHVLSGHTAAVNAVAIAQDTQKVVSGSTDGTLRDWDVVFAREQHVLKHHTAAVKAVAITQNGFDVVSGSDDGKLLLWDLGGKKVLYELNGHTAGVNAVTISWDSQRVVSGSSDGTLRIWGLDSGKILRVSHDQAQAIPDLGSAVVAGEMRENDSKSEESPETTTPDEAPALAGTLGFETESELAVLQAMALVFHVRAIFPKEASDDEGIDQFFGLVSDEDRGDFHHVRKLCEFLFSHPVRQVLETGEDPMMPPSAKTLEEFRTLVDEVAADQGAAYMSLETELSRIFNVARSEDRSAMLKVLGRDPLRDFENRRRATMVTKGVRTYPELTKPTGSDLTRDLADEAFLFLAAPYMTAFIHLFDREPTSLARAENFADYLARFFERWGTWTSMALRGLKTPVMVQYSVEREYLSAMKSRFPQFTRTLSIGKDRRHIGKKREQHTWSIAPNEFMRLMDALCEAIYHKVYNRLEGDQAAP